MAKKEKLDKPVEKPVVSSEPKRVLSTEGPTAKDIIIVKKPKGISL